MKIDNLHVEDLENFYNVVKRCKENGTEINYGSGLNSYFDKMEASFQISDVTSVELFYLIWFCNGSVHIISSEVNSTDGDNVNDTYIDQLITISSAISNDDDIKHDPENTIYPGYACKYSVLATLEGTTILSFLSATPDLVLGELFSTIDEKQNQVFPEYSEIDIEEIQNKFIYRFMNSFYKYMTDNLIQKTDIGIRKLDSYDMIKQDYYGYTSILLEGVDSVLVRANTPLRKLQFANANTEELQKGIQEIKSTFKEIISSTDRYFLENTFLFISVKSNFALLLELLKVLPLRTISDYESLDSVYRRSITSNHFKITKDLEKYRLRITNRLKPIYAEHSRSIENDTKVTPSLKEYLYLPMDADIKYTLKLSLEDISDIITSKEKSINEESCSRTELDMKTLFKRIEDLGISIYQLLYT